MIDTDMIFACVLTLIAGIGVGIGVESISTTKDCETLGQFRVDKTVFICTKVAK